MRPETISSNLPKVAFASRRRIFEDVYVPLHAVPVSAVSEEPSTIETELRRRRNPGDTHAYAIREVVENTVHASA